MVDSESLHISLQRISEIVSGESSTAAETEHLISCPECRLRIEKEKVLTKAITDFRRRQKDRESESSDPAESMH